MIGQRIEMPDADVWFYPAFFTADESAAWLQTLMDAIEWEQQHIRIVGQTIAIPRLTAWYGDPGKVYHYSGLTVHPHPWTAPLLTIKERLAAVTPTRFNSVLLNYYRDGQDSVSWHSDDEPELGTNPVIASLSFGAARPFQFKHKTDPDQRVSILLTSGSLLLMQGATQHHWKHQIPKRKTVDDGRINLTFRVIHSG